MFQFRARDVAEADREDPRVANAKGVLVESVAVRGWASLGRLNGGDSISSIDGQPVADVDALKTRMTDIEARKPASIVFEIRRGHPHDVHRDPAGVEVGLGVRGRRPGSRGGLRMRVAGLILLIAIAAALRPLPRKLLTSEPRLATSSRSAATP